MNEHLFARREPRLSTVDTVIETIKALLIEKKLKPGDPLPSESDLASQLSVSRGSIREATKILSAFGVIDIRRGDGTYVATTANRKLFDPLLFNLLVSGSDMKELVELRLLMETGIVRLIIEHAGDADLLLLEEVYRDLERSVRKVPRDPEGMIASDLAFHSTMGKISGNKLVRNVYDFVIELFAPTMKPGHGLEIHRKLLDALFARDPVAAVAAVEEHDGIWRRLNLLDSGKIVPVP